MKRTFSKFLCMVLALALMIGLLPATAVDVKADYSLTNTVFLQSVIGNALDNADKQTETIIRDGLFKLLYKAQFRPDVIHKEVLDRLSAVDGNEFGTWNSTSTDVVILTNGDVRNNAQTRVNSKKKTQKPLVKTLY